MKYLAFAFAATVLVSLLGVSESGVAEQPSFRSLIDPIIKEVLEKMRPQFANLKITDINQAVSYENLNITLNVEDMIVKNVDKFVIKNLKTNVVPLRLQNLTLIWNNVVGSGYYDFDIRFAVPGYNVPFRIHGKGDAQIILEDVFFTIGANMEMRDKAVQIKPKGLFGLDVVVNSATVTLSSMQGSDEFGDALGVFLSNVIPEFVNTLKKPIFKAFEDDIINVLNKILKNQSSLLMRSQLEGAMLGDSMERSDFEESY